jgi:hypothetical protein
MMPLLGQKSRRNPAVYGDILNQQNGMSGILGHHGLSFQRDRRARRKMS